MSLSRSTLSDQYGNCDGLVKTLLSRAKAQRTPRQNE